MSSPIQQQQKPDQQNQNQDLAVKIIKLFGQLKITQGDTQIKQKELTQKKERNVEDESEKFRWNIVLKQKTIISENYKEIKHQLLNMRQRDLYEYLHPFIKQKDDIKEVFIKNVDPTTQKKKVTDLPIFFAQIEEHVDHTSNLISFFFFHFHTLNKTKYTISFDEFYEMLPEFLNYHRNFLEKKEKNMLQQESEEINKLPLRKKTFETAYKMKNIDKFEAARISSLQLLCFKIANHNDELRQILSKYANLASEKLEFHTLESLKPTKTYLKTRQPDDQRKIEIIHVREIIKEITKKVGLVICNFEDFNQNPTENDEAGLSCFEEYLLLKTNIQQRMQQFTKKVRSPPVKLASQGTIKAKFQFSKVLFADEALVMAKKHHLCFSIDFFLYIIDKFFSQQLQYYCQETDNEFKNYLLRNSKSLEQIDVLDEKLNEFLFNQNTTQPDIGIIDFEKERPTSKAMKIERKSEPELKNVATNEIATQTISNSTVKFSKDVEQMEEVKDQFLLNLENSITQYEEMLKSKQKQLSNSEKIEILKLLDIMKAQKSEYEYNLQDKLQQTEKKTQKELWNLRKKGLRDIYNNFKDSQKSKGELLSLNNFLQFCNQFTIPLEQQTLILKFKHLKNSSKGLSFLEFIDFLEQIQQEIQNKQIKGTSVQEFDIFDYIGCHNPANYKKKMQNIEQQYQTFENSENQFARRRSSVDNNIFDSQQRQKMEDQAQKELKKLEELQKYRNKSKLNISTIQHQNKRLLLQDDDIDFNLHESSKFIKGIKTGQNSPNQKFNKEGLQAVRSPKISISQLRGSEKKDLNLSSQLNSNIAMINLPSVVQQNPMLNENFKASFKNKQLNQNPSQQLQVENIKNIKIHSILTKDQQQIEFSKQQNTGKLFDNLLIINEMQTYKPKKVQAREKKYQNQSLLQQQYYAYLPKN